MTAQSQRPIDYAHYLPWTRLLRSFRIATDPRKLALAGLAITVFWLGESAIAYLPFARTETSAAAPWNAVEPVLLVDHDGVAVERLGVRLPELAARILAPIAPLLDLVALPFGGQRSWAAVADLWTRLFWAFAVWALFGGAIARIAAVEFARDERPGIIDALVFSARRFVSFFSAPLLPLSGILAVWAACAAGGLLGRIPLAGTWIAAALWGFALLAALLVVLMAVATAAGWPLMIAAVSTEGSDAFDGFSRSFSYLYGRPWLFVWYVGLALSLGTVFVAAVDTLAVGVAAAAARTVETGSGPQVVAELHAAAPDYIRDGVPGPAALSRATGPARLASAWLGVLATLGVGFAASYFWTAATIVYFLLRRADDATHFDEVWLGEREEDDDLLPLAGIASTDQPVIERPHRPTAAPPAATG